MSNILLSIHDIKLNLTDSEIPPTVHVKQYDHLARSIRCTLYEGLQEYTIPQNTSLICSGARPDGRFFSYHSVDSEIVSQVNNRIVIAVTAAMTENEGRYPVDIVLLDQQGSVLRTFSFIIQVEACAVKHGKILKRTFSNALSEVSETITEVFITDDGYLAILCNDGSFLPPGSESDIVSIIHEELVNSSINNEGKMVYETEQRYGLSFAMDNEGKISVIYGEAQ